MLISGNEDSISKAKVLNEITYENERKQMQLFQNCSHYKSGFCEVAEFKKNINLCNCQGCGNFSPNYGDKTRQMI